MIKRVKVVGVNVGDQQRARDFFVQTLGFRVVVDEPMGPGARWLEVAPPEGGTRLALWTPPGLEDRVGTFTHIVFLSDDVEATARELKSRGVVFQQEPKEQPGGVMAVFQDPDGNSYVIAGE